MSAQTRVRYDVADGVATVALDDPDTRNALSDELLGDLLDALRRGARRRGGAVRRAGLDEPEDVQLGRQPLRLRRRRAARPQALGHGALPEVFRLLGGLGKPSICAASGHVLAGALGLALACDLVVAREGATFGTPEINVGVFPFMIMALIYRNVPRKKTNELLLLGERIDAARGRAARARQQGRARTRSSTPRWPTGRGRLAAKSPVMMRLGKDAMYRQQDLALRRRARAPAPQPDARLLDRGHPGGRPRVLREARAAVDGPVSAAAVVAACAAGRPTSA